jgi:hypothetical protein
VCAVCIPDDSPGTASRIRLAPSCPSASRLLSRLYPENRRARAVGVGPLASTLTKFSSATPLTSTLTKKGGVRAQVPGWNNRGRGPGKLPVQPLTSDLQPPFFANSFPCHSYAHLSRKPCVCHSYAFQGGRGVPFPTGRPACPDRSWRRSAVPAHERSMRVPTLVGTGDSGCFRLFNCGLSTSRVTSHESPVTHSPA